MPVSNIKKPEKSNKPYFTFQKPPDKVISSQSYSLRFHNIFASEASLAWIIYPSGFKLWTNHFSIIEMKYVFWKEIFLNLDSSKKKVMSRSSCMKHMLIPASIKMVEMNLICNSHHFPSKGNGKHFWIQKNPIQASGCSNQIQIWPSWENSWVKYIHQSQRWPGNGTSSQILHKKC